MNVNDKIKQILIDKSLTPSVFADEIGVQRSSISHILSGRNRPSFDIIQKVLKRFPDLGYDWIMEDDNSDDTVTVKKTPSRTPKESSQPTRQEIFHPQQRLRQPSTTSVVEAVQPKPNFTDQALPATSPDKAVERILIFFTDGTFREYIPAS